jgi:hypothetical protein
MLMMQDLFFVAQKTASTLHSLLKKYRIDAVPGENIKVVTTTVMSISRRIWFSKKRSFPDEFLSTVLKLFQTSSVPEFNDHFKSLTTDRRKEVSDQRIAFLTSTVSSPPMFCEDLVTVQRICDGANNVYEQMVRDGLWNTTIKTKPNSTSHALNTTTVTCFNCEKQHHLNDCPEPRDKEKVEQNKAKFRKSKSVTSDRKTTTSSGSISPKKTNAVKTDKNHFSSKKNLFKWRPPDRNESKRVISTQSHGERVYVWDPSTKRWNPEEAPAVNVTTGSSATLTTATPSNNAGIDAALRAQVADVQRQLHALNEKL